MTPRVTVVMAAYNHEPYVAEAIESVLAQRTSFDWDLVIFEDCSTDRTRAIVSDYAARYPDRIRLVLSRHNKDYALWLDAIRNATGDCVAVLDGDDYWTSPEKLQKQLAFMDAHPDYAFTFHDVEIVYDDPRTERIRMLGQAAKRVVTFDDMLLGNDVPWSSTMFRRAIAAAAPGWFLNVVYSDWALNLLCARHGPAGYLPEVLGVYRRHGKGMWSSLSKQHRIEELISATELFADKFGIGDAKTIQDALAAHWTSLAVVHRAEGNRSEAARCIARARETRAFRGMLLWRAAIGWTGPSRSLYRAWCKLQRVSGRALAARRA